MTAYSNNNSNGNKSDETTAATATTFDGTTLPRSIRWRLQLGLLKMPTSTSTQSNDAPVNTLQSLCAANQSFLKEQRKRYEGIIVRVDGDRFLSLGDEDDDDDDHADNNKADGNDANNTEALDPLSLMVHQQDLRDEKEARQRQYRRKSSSVDIVRSQEICQVVKKDLNRLHDEHASYYRSRANWKHHMGGDSGGEETSFEKAIQERNELLTEILHAYGKEHVPPGYQQGMHEICSYLMFVLEMDLFDIETMESTDYADILHADYLLHDTFTMTEAIITLMEHAFGVADAGHAKPVEEMGDSILHKVQYVARDKNLYTHLQSMEWSLELYCARWVRLLFAREVGGWRNVLSLWDIFLDCITKADRITSMAPSKYTRPGLDKLLQLGNFELMAVLETTAASFLWLCRDQLMSHHRADDGVQAVTGMDPLKEVGPLISTLLSSLRRLQISKTMAPLLHPDQKKLANNSCGRSPKGLRGSNISLSPKRPETTPPKRRMYRASSMSHVLPFAPSLGRNPSAGLTASPKPTRPQMRRRSSLQHFSIQAISSTVESSNSESPTVSAPNDGSPRTSSNAMSKLVHRGTSYLFHSDSVGSAGDGDTSAQQTNPQKEQRMRRAPTEESGMTELVDLDKNHLSSQPAISDEESLRQSFLRQNSLPAATAVRFEEQPAPQSRVRMQRRSSLSHDSTFTMDAQRPRQRPVVAAAPSKQQQHEQRRRAKRRSSLDSMSSWMATSAAAVSSTLLPATRSGSGSLLATVSPTTSDESKRRQYRQPELEDMLVDWSSNKRSDSKNIILMDDASSEKPVVDDSTALKEQHQRRLKMSHANSNMKLLLSAPPSSLFGGNQPHQSALFDVSTTDFDPKQRISIVEQQQNTKMKMLMSTSELSPPSLFE